MSRWQFALLTVLGLVLATGPGFVASSATAAETFEVSSGLRATFHIEDAEVDVYDQSGDRADHANLEHDDLQTTLPAGTYDFVYTGHGPYYDRGGDQFTFAVHDVVIDQDHTDVDATVPETSLTVHLQGPDHLPRSGMVDLSCVREVGTGEFYPTTYRQQETFSPESGDTHEVTGFEVPSTAPAGSGCQLAVFPEDGSFYYQDVHLDSAGSNEVTVTLPDPVNLTGRLAPPMGQFDSGGSITVTDQSGRDVQYATTDPDGYWSTRITPGTYDFALDNSGPDGGVHIRLHDVEVDEGTVVDASPPYAPLTVHLVGADGQPVDGTVYTMCGPGADREQWTQYIAMHADGPNAHLTVASGPEWFCQTVGIRSPAGDNDDFSRTLTVPASGGEWTYVVPTHQLIEGAPDSNNDSDGVSDVTESLAPNNGDGNNDGTPDSQQANVTSLPAGGASPGAGTPYVTVAAPTGATLVDVSTMKTSDAATPPPSGVILPSGLVSYTLDGVAPASDQSVTIYTDTTGVNAYAKYDATTHVWSQLPADRVQIETGKVTIRLTDGGIGDADGLANGAIVDPGGPAKVSTGDTTAPTVTGRATTRPNAAGWYLSNVRVDWTATDPSRVKAQPPDTIVSAEGASVTAMSPVVCDKAPTPNCGRGTLTGLKIDKTAPSLSVTGVANGATYTLGNVPTPGCVASDDTSGLAAPCRGVRSGGTSAGVGTFSYAASAVDRAGNTRVVTASYRVTYRFDGFAQPINDPGPPVSVFKAGSTVPAAFTLMRSNGQTATPAAKPVWVSPVRGARTSAPVNEPVANTKGTSGNAFVLRNGVWHFDWSTRGLAAGYLYRIGVRLDDGTTHYVTVGLK